MVDKPDICAVCGWKLADQPKHGCTVGFCSQRIHPSVWHDKDRALAEIIDAMRQPDLLKPITWEQLEDLSRRMFEKHVSPRAV